ncbi:MAG: multiheme c-type cytochrome [Acidobacteriota bacterium]
MALLLTAAILWLAGGAPAAGGAEELRADALNPSSACGQCHQEIYEMWGRSMHSAALSDPIFQTSYMRAYLETGGRAKEICLRCHAPVAALTGDLDLRRPLSREGIQCDFCHSVVSVDLQRARSPFRLSLDGVKRGPLGDADSPAHEVARSELHLSAEFCAGCHEYSNEEGLPILSTYSEWRLSPQAAEGKTCQHCHMPLTPGDTVRADLSVGREAINLHNISGSHSPDQVRRAATARILRIERQQPTVALVEVEVANVGSGHSIPTGMPTRRLVLEVVVFVRGREVRRFERHFQRALLDARGRLISDDHRAILQARSIREDNRLAPGERRIERFVAAVPGEGALRAEMTLKYLYEPQLVAREKMSIQIAFDRAP